MKKILISVATLLSAPAILVAVYKLGHFYGVLARWLGATNNETTNDIVMIQAIGMVLTFIAIITVAAIFSEDND